MSKDKLLVLDDALCYYRIEWFNFYIVSMYGSNNNNTSHLTITKIEDEIKWKQTKRTWSALLWFAGVILIFLNISSKRLIVCFFVFFFCFLNFLLYKLEVNLRKDRVQLTSQQERTNQKINNMRAFIVSSYHSLDMR